MNLQVSVDNLELTDKVKKIIINKFEKPLTRLLGKLDSNEISADFHLQRLSFGDYQVNFEMAFPAKKNVYAKNTSSDLVSAITGLREQVEKQIKKIKE
jgi:ribosomal subunit interface protein